MPRNATKFNERVERKREAIAAVRRAIRANGEQAVADAIPTTLETVRRWDRGENAPTTFLVTRILSLYGERS